MPFSGNITTTACSGTIQDHAGNGNYSNGANGYVIINPPGNAPVSITFSQFSTESCCDRVYLYDGSGITGTLLGNYGGGGLPNGGQPITATSGALTVRFFSDGSVISSGFTATWTAAGGNATPQATLSVSTTNPAFNTPVTFTNTSSFKTTAWLFGDGNTSTDDVAIHQYTAAGTYQARLVVENCNGVKDTSNPVNITVQASPLGSISTDTVKISVPCGSINSSSFSIANAGGGGALSYNLALGPNASNTAFSATFEGSLDGFVNQSLIYYNTSFANTNAPQGNEYLLFQGDGNFNDGLKAVFPAQAATTISYKTMYTASTLYSGYIEAGQFTNGTFNRIFYSVYYYGSLRLYYGNGFGGTYVYYGPNTANAWHDIELRNINYVTQTYDIYLNGTMVVANAAFMNPATAVNQIEVYSPYQGTTGIDDFYVGDETGLSAISFSPITGTLAGGSNATIFINANATGLNAGTYYLDFVVSSNDTALDGLTIPLELTVTGFANLIQNTSAVALGSMYNTQTVTDSVLLFNSGCDTLNFTSFTTSTSDITVNTAPFDVAPGDTGYVFYTFAPTQVANYTDSIYLNGPDTNSFVQLSAQVLGAPSISVNPTSVNISITGCPDTVDFGLTIYNSGLSALNWGATAIINGVNSDDFEGAAINTMLWSNWSSGVSVGNSCGVINGSKSLIFNGSGARYIQTVPLNTSGGGNLEFDYWQSSCEFADNGEGLYVFYSNNNGLTWTQMAYYYTTSTATFNATLAIPTAAQTNATVFKIQQTTNSGNNFDNWVIDDFSISSSFNNSVIFTPDTGAVSINDSTQILGQILTTGMAAGTYTFPVFISSNDPNNAVINVPVTLTIVGAPSILEPALCLQDTTMENTTAIDSAMIVNDGCANLVITNVQTATSIYAPITTSATVLPGDTAYLQYSFTPTGAGVFLDSLQLTSNAPTAYVCLNGYGLGAPAIAVDSTLISVTLNGCLDSSTVSLNLANVGAGGLLYQFEGGNSDTLKILALTTGYTYTSYANALSALSANMQQPFVVTPLFTTSAATLDAALQNDIDILWIPSLVSNYSSTYQLFAPVVQAFVNAGGYLVVSGTYRTLNILNLGIFNGSTAYNVDYGNQALSINSGFANHPLLQGVTAPLLSANATYYYTLTNTGLRTLLSRSTISTYQTLYELDYGAGKAVWFGFDMYVPNTNTSRMFTNAFTYYGSLAKVPDWLRVVPDSGLVNAGDTAVINLTFRANGNGSGVYNDTLTLASNDPIHPTIRIPVQLTINGSADISVDQNCIPFDSTFVGLTKTIPSTIYNPGCDTLVINSTTSLSNAFSVQNLPLSIPPYDSALVTIGFTPNAIGWVQDTIQVFSNAVAVPGICVNGYGKGAPAVTPATDTIRVTVNKCDGFTQFPMTFANTGQGALNYSMIEKSIYRQSSTQNYTTTYATTTHTFTNTPTVVDTIFFMSVVNGDFNSDFGGEVYTFRAENYTLPIYDNNAPDGTNDTSYGFYTGALISTWLADNQLDVTMINGYGVNPGVGQDMHFVEVRMESTPTWLTILSGKTGNLSTGANTSKTILINVNSLAVGSYTSSILIESNDPVNPVYTVYVELDVVDKPTMEIPVNCINYGAVNGITPITDSVLIVNSGCKNLVINNLQFANPVFSSPIATLTIPAKDSAYIPVTLTPTQAAVLNSTMLVFSNDTNLPVCLTATVSLAPIAAYDYQILDVCEGEVDFTDLSSNSPNQWSWNFGDGKTSTQQNPTHFYEKPGVYTVQLLTSNNGGTDTASQTLDMSKVLFVDFSMPDTVRAGVPAQFFDSSMVATSWQWYFGDGGNSTLQNPTHTYASPGTYFLTMVASSADCSAQKSRQVVVVSGIGIGEEKLAGVVIFPVPSSNLVTAQWVGEEQFTQAMVYDMTGKQLLAAPIANQTEITFDVANLADGVYFLKLESASGYTQIKRFIIRH